MPGAGRSRRRGRRRTPLRLLSARPRARSPRALRPGSAPETVRHARTRWSSARAYRRRKPFPHEERAATVPLSGGASCGHTVDVGHAEPLLSPERARIADARGANAALLAHAAGRHRGDPLGRSHGSRRPRPAAPLRLRAPGAARCSRDLRGAHRAPRRLPRLRPLPQEPQPRRLRALLLARAARRLERLLRGRPGDRRQPARPLRDVGEDLRRLLGSAVLAFAAFAPPRRIRVGRGRAGRGHALDSCGAARGGRNRVRPWLPAPDGRRARSDAGRREPASLSTGTCAVLVAQLLGMGLYVLAAIGFAHKAHRDEGRADDVARGRGRVRGVRPPQLLPVPVACTPTGSTSATSSGSRSTSRSSFAAVQEIRSYWEKVSQTAVLEERRRIARDLHDGLAQELAFIGRNLRSLDADDPTVARVSASAARALSESRLAHRRADEADRRAARARARGGRPRDGRTARGRTSTSS